jgi:hypothetical protein
MSNALIDGIKSCIKYLYYDLMYKFQTDTLCKGIY